MKAPVLATRTRALHLVALSSFAIAEPVLQRFGDQPTYLAVRGFRAGDVIVLGVALLIAAPAILLGLELLAGLLHPRFGMLVHQLFVGLLAFVILIRVADLVPTGLPVVVVLFTALVVAQISIAWEPARMFLTLCALAPLLFLALFLVKAPLAALSATDSGAETMPEVPGRNPVVVVIFDEFALSSLMTESGGLDAVRYPNFAALSRTSTWYRNATTVYDATDWAVPALLSGRLRRGDQLPIVADHPKNLFTLLGRSYSVRAFEAETRLCPTNICPNAAPSLATRLGRVAAEVKTASLLQLPPWQGDWSNPRDEVASFLEAVTPGRRPQLDVLHVLLPHTPYRYLPSGRAYEDQRWARDYNAPYRSSENSSVVHDVYQRYLLQLAYTDRVLGQVMSRLRSRGLWDRSLVIVTADHGISFRPGEHRRYVNSRNIADIAPIPLFVKRPWQHRGALDERRARSIDIVPTIADVLGIDVPWRLDGTSLFASDRRVPTEFVVTGYMGNAVRASLGEVRAGRQAAIAWKTRSFGSGAESLFARGRYRQLLGKKTASYPAWRSATVTAEIRRPSSTRFDPRSSLAPARIEGTVSGLGAGRSLALAVAVNGRIAAVTETFRDGAATRFATLVPDSALRVGANAIAILAIRAEGRGQVAFAKIGSRD